jgi:hypothetical protein
LAEGSILRGLGVTYLIQGGHYFPVAGTSDPLSTPLILIFLEFFVVTLKYLHSSFAKKVNVINMWLFSGILEADFKIEINLLLMG